MKAIQKISTRIQMYAIFAVPFFCSCNSNPGNQATLDSIKYELISSWPQLPNGYTLSQVTGLDVDTMQNVFVFHRTGRSWTEPFPDSVISMNTVLMLERSSGKILNSWGAGYFIMPHGLAVDHSNNVWVTDVALQQVFKFSHDGKLLMTVGESKVAGNDSLHFNLPTDVAIARDGSFYVSDGYGNSRVVKFSPEGKYQLEWGTAGKEPGEFNTPHGIDLDEEGNVYVADRENNRMQKFDAQGKFLSLWQNTKTQLLHSLTVDSKDQLLAIDYIEVDSTIIGSDIFQFDASGNLLYQFGRSGRYSGPVCRYHDIAVDNEGSIYVGDIIGNTVQKFQIVSHE